MYIDTHAHLTKDEYSDLAEVIKRAREANVEAILNASFDIASSREAVKLAQEYDFIYAAVGIHPHHAPEVNDNIFAEIKELAKDKKVAAIGEMGIDYFKNISPQDVQQHVFRKFLALAQELELPAIVHCRDAQEDTIRIMREENNGKLRGVFHCFAGDERLVRFAQEIGFLISFTGNITFKKADQVRENARKAPLEMIMIETDCPYMAPEPYRGQRNEPAYVVRVAEKIAEVRNMRIEEVAMETTRNAKKLFGI
ncbi:MAG: TatD family hydrolase [Candidatus Margulisbacteria bacterium]|nr:TatD family hydrolase [Candidatus Margulisiibacteriota bacterium]